MTSRASHPHPFTARWRSVALALDLALLRQRSPWLLTWHALERYVERVCPDLPYEDAMVELARACRESSWSGCATRTGEDVWHGEGGLWLVVAGATSRDPVRPVLVTVYARNESALPRLCERTKSSHGAPGTQRGRRRSERVAKQRREDARREAEALGEVRDVLGGAT